MELFSLQSLLLFFAFAFSFYVYHRRNLFPSKYKPKYNPHFPIYPVVGSLPQFLKNRNRFLDWSSEVLSLCPTNTVVFSSPVVNIHGIVTASPENLEHMLKTNFENYPKGILFITVLEDFLGRGIFNSDGDIWKVQRKTASHEFNTKSLRNFVMGAVTHEIQARLIPLFKKTCESNQVIDLQDVLERFAFDNVCKVSFNVDPSCLSGGTKADGEFMLAFEAAATISSARFMYSMPILWMIKRFLGFGSEKKLRESIRIVHDFADRIIRSRLEEKTECEDLLSRFIRNEDNSPEFLRDIIISFILAGRDTTSTALTWFFWLLSSRSDVQQKILDELQSIRNLHGKRIGDTYSLEELREMHYLHAAVTESMRLYPPVPIDTKTSLKDDVLPDGTLIGKGWLTVYHTYAMGRMENIWGPDCREYLPERFLESGTFRPENQFRYPVFNAGPRLCLGKEMAYIQMKSIAASVLERFEVVMQDKDKCPEILLSLTLRMNGGLPVKIKERKMQEC